MAIQSSWRFCDKCTSMFFDGYPQKGHCPAGGGHHSSGFNFFLPHDVPGSATKQTLWRYCQKCEAMFYDGRPNKGHCAAGGGHQSQGFMFVLPHDVPATAFAQAAWRFCQKCTVMFYDGRPNKGRCAAGGGHEAQGFMFVLPHDTEKDNPELGDPTGGGKGKGDPPNDPPPEDGPTKNPDNVPPSPEGGCFIGGTPVWMADGTIKRIDAIAAGDQVIARNEHTGGMGVGAVDRVFRHQVSRTLLLQMSQGEVIETTAEHRFAAEERGFVGAGELRPGDRLLTHKDQGSAVLAAETQLADATVYNLSVEQLHTFFVGHTGLWVHNVKKSDPEPPPDGSKGN